MNNDFTFIQDYTLTYTTAENPSLTNLVRFSRSEKIKGIKDGYFVKTSLNGDLPQRGNYYLNVPLENLTEIKDFNIVDRVSLETKKVSSSLTDKQKEMIKWGVILVVGISIISLVSSR